MSELDAWIEAGRITRPHGVKGDVFVDFKPDLEPCLAGGLNVRTVGSDGAVSSLEVERYRNHSGRVVIKFVGVDTRGAAESLRGLGVWLDRSDIGALEEDRWFVQDLIGIEVLADARNEIARSACLAITEVELLFFERRAFNEQVLCNPALGHRLLRYLASRHMDPQGGVRHTGSDQDALGELLLRLGALCGDSDPSGLVRLPEAINPRTLQELSGLAGRRFRDAWGAIDTLGSEDSQVVFCGESLLNPAQEAFDEPSPS